MLAVGQKASENAVINLIRIRQTQPIANARDRQPTNDDDASDTVNEQPVICS